MCAVLSGSVVSNSLRPHARDRKFLLPVPYNEHQTQNNQMESPWAWLNSVQPSKYLLSPSYCSWTSLMTQMVKNLPAMQETWVWPTVTNTAAHICLQGEKLFGKYSEPQTLCLSNLTIWGWINPRSTPKIPAFTAWGPLHPKEHSPPPRQWK